MQERYVVIRWNNIDMIRLDRHAIFHLENGHGGKAAKQFRQNAFGCGLEMLDEDKSQARLRRHGPKERFKSL